ncbi:MAG TPA: hypothetical protein VIH95_04955 [Acidimicrobiales bacterium]
MEGPITDSAREAMLLAALSRVDVRSFRESLQVVSDPRSPISKPIANALAALRKHRDPSSVLGKAQYRAALPYAAAVYAEPCLAAVIEALGDDADDPSEERLLEAIDSVGADHDDTTVTVMLASVADGEMAASDLCFSLLDSDGRFGLPGWQQFERSAPEPAAERTPVAAGASQEQRDARRAKKHREAEERRKRAEAATKAAEQVRVARKKERAAASERPSVATDATPAPVLPTMRRRRAVLTPLEEEEFDRDDLWTAGVVLAWVPFDAEDPDHPDLEGKIRPCVVVAGTPTHLLVRPGYSAGGVKSRDWKSVPVRYWRQSGFDEPTWIDVDAVRVVRPDSGPTGFLEPDDWNSLW